MSSPIERPVFYEGQILSADDLGTTVEHARDQLARHARYLHLWGIADGLELSAREKKDAAGVAYQEITLSAGIAIDGRGREIIVPEAERLSEGLFDDLNVLISDPAAFYPVFLSGRDETASLTAVATRACSSSQTTRKVESYEVSFGRPGEELDLDKQTPPGVADQLEELSDEKPWLILLGFIQWDPKIGSGKFTSFKSESNGVGRRYAGVQADEVVARAGSLTLRSSPRNQADKPALVLDEATGQMRFGLQSATGIITEVFTVDKAGNVTAKGKVSGAVTPGSVQIQSGVIFDGVVIPLPPGITEQQVIDGVTLSIHLTPHVPGSAPPTADPDWVSIPIECKLDGTSRRVLCRFRWFRLSTPGTFQDKPGLCDFTVLASVPPTTGS